MSRKDVLTASIGYLKGGNSVAHVVTNVLDEAKDCAECTHLPDGLGPFELAANSPEHVSASDCTAKTALDLLAAGTASEIFEWRTAAKLDAEGTT